MIKELIEVKKRIEQNLRKIFRQKQDPLVMIDKSQSINAVNSDVNIKDKSITNINK